MTKDFMYTTIKKKKKKRKGISLFKYPENLGGLRFGTCFVVLLWNRGAMLSLCLKGLLLFRSLNLKGAECSQLSLTSMSPSPSATFNGIWGNATSCSRCFPHRVSSPVYPISRTPGPWLGFSSVGFRSLRYVQKCVRTKQQLYQNLARCLEISTYLHTLPSWKEKE